MTDVPINDGPAASAQVLVSFALCVRHAQAVARRVEYLAANVEESIEDVADFHAAVDSLLGGAPLSAAARRLRDGLTDADRALLSEMRRVRTELVHDFFFEHPMDGPDETFEPAVRDRAQGRLRMIADVLRRAEALMDRLERMVSGAETPT
ncbi:hypothetical protein [Roseospira navarrensis]|uniref:Uncharacterized protein n=1 Tax=Roseospira navarrensis TaxID=140058 RepID=A0A7X1ZC87_9PROT|nr:hypothetical protein [Roseospira navarrensis]MQX35894.1 hypothetical protein [Roseospira navarrensis]